MLASINVVGYSEHDQDGGTYFLRMTLSDNSVNQYGIGLHLMGTADTLVSGI